MPPGTSSPSQHVGEVQRLAARGSRVSRSTVAQRHREQPRRTCRTSGPSQRRRACTKPSSSTSEGCRAGRLANSCSQLSQDLVEHRRGVGHRAADDLSTSAVAVCCSSASLVSLNSRTFSIAITAWSAKVCSSAISLLGKRARARAATPIAPMPRPSRSIGTASRAAKARPLRAAPATRYCRIGVRHRRSAPAPSARIARAVIEPRPGCHRKCGAHGRLAVRRRAVVAGQMQQLAVETRGAQPHARAAQHAGRARRSRRTPAARRSATR